MSSLDDWCHWRGQIVRIKDAPGSRASFEYVVVCGNAADYIKKAIGDRTKRLVLIPITRDTDEDSFELANRGELVVVL